MSKVCKYAHKVYRTMGWIDCNTPTVQEMYLCWGEKEPSECPYGCDETKCPKCEKWLYKGKYYNDDMWECSRCGLEIIGDKPNYCPNCGQEYNHWDGKHL